MRLSDIFKKASQKQENKQESIPHPPPIPTAPAEKPVHSEAQPLTSIVQPRISRFSPEDTYTEAIITIKDILAGAAKGTPYARELPVIPKLVYLTENFSDEMLMLADRATPDIYLYGHCVNVCVYALILGWQLKLGNDAVTDLAFASFLHDSGMIRMLPVVLKKEKLSARELQQVRRHPEHGREIVNALPGLDERRKKTAVAAMSELYEKGPVSAESSGRLSFGRIVAVADVYEALSHPRSFRDRYLPNEALKIMINSTDRFFDPAIIKALIEKVSLYPPGSFVRLNTDEIGRVVAINPEQPTRPRIRVIIDASRHRIQNPSLLDLAAHPMMFVKEAVDETRIDVADKKLALELKAARWWVRGL